MPPASGKVNEHLPVLAGAAVEHLLTRADGTYVDGTFGRGGHARMILQRLSPQGRLIALDRDPQAEVAARAIGDPRFRFVRSRFSQMQDTLRAVEVTTVDGILLDLGVSSPQIDDPARGFSWRASGPLDMRMDPTQGPSAAQWLGRASIDELTRVIRDYGEERFAAPIAKAIVARRAAGQPPATTADLARLVADTLAVKGRASAKDRTQHPATRTFQAVRIHINQELEELAIALQQSLALLAAGGRLAVLSFHSLEDRIVKRFIEAHAHPDRAAARVAARSRRVAQLPLRAAPAAPVLRAVARVMADAAERAANPRARSAVLRVAERTAIALADGTQDRCNAHS